MSTSSLPSFIKIHQAVLEKKLKMWKFTDGRRTDRRTDDDGRTDDGRCAMTIAHLSLWLRWAKNSIKGYKKQNRESTEGYSKSIVRRKITTSSEDRWKDGQTKFSLIYMCVYVTYRQQKYWHFSRNWNRAWRNKNILIG